MGRHATNQLDPDWLALATVALQTNTGLRDIAAADSARSLAAAADPEGTWGRLADLGAWLAAASGQCPPRPLTTVHLVTFNRAGPGAEPQEVGAEIALSGAVLDAHQLPEETTAAEAFAWGRQIADRLIDAGTDLLVPLGPAEDALAASPSCALIVAAVQSLSSVEAVGFDGFVDEASWANCLVQVRDRLRGTSSDPRRCLAEVASGPALAMVGLLLQAAVRRTPVLLDGALPVTCALAAQSLVDDSRHWWLFADVSDRLQHRRSSSCLYAEPILHLGLGLDDGTAAEVALLVLRRAQALLASAAQDQVFDAQSGQHGGGQHGGEQRAAAISAADWDPQGEHIDGAFG